MVTATCPHCLGTKTSPLTDEDCHVCKKTEVCSTCSGSGVIGAMQEDCPDCEGGKIETVTGSVQVGGRHGKNAAHSIALYNRINIPEGVFHSYEVLSCFASAEWNALTDGQKDNIKVLLSCGKVDLRDGQYGHQVLWAYFDAESTTRSNLITLTAP